MGVFDKTYATLFTTRRATLQFRDKLMGGVPNDPKIIRNWLATKPGLINDDAHHKALVIETALERGIDVHEGMSYNEILEAVGDVADTLHLNGFKRDANGLYIEARQVKAMFKESTNILYAGQRWGKTGKGPKGFLAERIFVEPDKIYLGVTEPSGIELVIGHVSGPKGPQSTLTHHEYVEQPRLTVDCLCTRDAITEEQWSEIWTHAERNGLGALRSQGHGVFEVISWEEVPTTPRSSVADRLLASIA
jgi:hypothetical protein